jgi:sterol desaturase/sphingolipid hydroxylase (fatty acid hydroxylase superfamily)
MLHHHADHDGGFGVSSPLWDLIFRTMPEAKKRPARVAG